jgi:thioredoxin 1
MASPFTITLTQGNFETEVLKSSVPVLVDFWGESCPPCKMIAPVIDELADEYQGKAKIGKVSTDQNMELAVEYRIRAVPTLLIFKNGQVVEQMIGAKSKRDLKASLDKAIA